MLQNYAVTVTSNGGIFYNLNSLRKIFRSSNTQPSAVALKLTLAIVCEKAACNALIQAIQDTYKVGKNVRILW